MRNYSRLQIFLRTPVCVLSSLCLIYPRRATAIYFAAATSGSPLPPCDIPNLLPSPPSFFSPTLCKRERFGFSSFEFSRSSFFPPSPLLGLYLVSEFLVLVSGQSRFPISLPRTRIFPLLLTSAFASATLLPFAAPASRVIISIRDCDANFYCFRSRRSTRPRASTFFLLSRAFCPFSAAPLVLTPRILQRTVFYFIHEHFIFQFFVTSLQRGFRWVQK